MINIYIHDQSKQTVYAGPDQPTVQRISGHFDVSAEFKVTHGNNIYRANKDQWDLPLVFSPRERYIHPTDTSESVARHFKNQHYPKGVQISKDEYERLQKVYQSRQKQE